MKINFLRNILSFLTPKSSSETVGQGAQAFEKKAAAKLIDVAEGSRLTEEAKRQNIKLQQMMKNKHRSLDRLPVKEKIRKGVKKNLADFYDCDEIAEEVTERLYEAAQYDSRLKKMFGN